MTPEQQEPSGSTPSGGDETPRRGLPRIGRPLGDVMRTVGPVMSVGFAFVFSLAIGYMVGLTLDGWFDSSPWFTVIFALIGLAAGILTVYRVVRDAMRG